MSLRRLLKLKIGVATLLACFAALLPARGQNIPEHTRAVVDRTQRDLRQAEDFERHRGRNVARYENTLRNLSEFDRGLTGGRFRNGKLGASIHGLKNLVEHNILEPEGRDALRKDLADLRALREEHEHHR